MLFINTEIEDTQTDPISSDIKKSIEGLTQITKNIVKVKKILTNISDYCLAVCQKKADILVQNIELYENKIKIFTSDSKYLKEKNKFVDDFLKGIKSFNDIIDEIKENYEQIAQINEISNNYIFHYFEKNASTLMANNISNIHDSEININFNNINENINESLDFPDQYEENKNNFYSDESSNNKKNSIIINDNNSKSNTLNQYQKFEIENKEITEKFLKSFNFVIKSIILKANYLLKKERERQNKDYYEYNNLRNVDYPILNNKEELWSDKLFIESINKKLEKDFTIKKQNEIMDNNTFSNNLLDKKIINEIKNIFIEPMFEKILFSAYDSYFLNLSEEEEAIKGSNNIVKDNIMIIQNNFDLDGFLKNTSREYLNKFQKKKI